MTEQQLKQQEKINTPTDYMHQNGEEKDYLLVSEKTLRSVELTASFGGLVMFGAGVYLESPTPQALGAMIIVTSFASTVLRRFL